MGTRQSNSVGSHALSLLDIERETPIISIIFTYLGDEALTISGKAREQCDVDRVGEAIEGAAVDAQSTGAIRQVKKKIINIDVKNER